MKTLSTRRKTWERVAFTGSLLLATVVVAGALAASSRVEPIASRGPLSGLRPTPELPGLKNGLEWAVEGIGWRSETTEVESEHLDVLIDSPISVDRSVTTAAEHWGPIAELLKHRMEIVHEDKTTLLLGQDAEAFRARVTLIKSPGEPPLLAGVRVARRDRLSSWTVLTHRHVPASLPPASAAPLPLSVSDRLTAVGRSLDGTVQAAMVELASSPEALAMSWDAAGWTGRTDELTSPGASVVCRRGHERVRVTLVEEDQLALVRL